MAKIMVLGVLAAVASAFSMEAMVRSVSTPNECTEKLFHIMNNVSESSLFNTIIISSGKSPNDLGNFERCVSREELEYVLVTVSGDSAIRQRVQMGMCVPNVCNQTTLKAFNKFY